jgi:hypothetical protein
MNRIGMGWILLQTATSLLMAADPLAASRYERIYRTARSAWQTQPTNSEAASQLARACFDMVEFAAKGTQRIDYAKQGIAAAREAVARDFKLVAGHYYLAMNLGQLADAMRNLGGLKLVAEMEREFHTARKFDAAFDFAGADRSLGLLYRDAPGWPISVGNRTKARQHLEQARKLSTDYPDNQLTMLETWLKWGEREKVSTEVKVVEEVLAAARRKLTGEEWACSWTDWDRRWHELQLKVARQSPRPAVSPKGAR